MLAEVLVEATFPDGTVGHRASADRMIPGEIFTGSGDIEMNAAALSRLQMRSSTPAIVRRYAAPRPSPAGHRALSFDRATAHGHCSDIPAATACASSRHSQIVGLVWADGAISV